MKKRLLENTYIVMNTMIMNINYFKETQYEEFI